MVATTWIHTKSVSDIKSYLLSRAPCWVGVVLELLCKCSFIESSLSLSLLLEIYPVLTSCHVGVGEL